VLPGGLSVGEQLRRVIGELAPAERRVARALLAVYPAAGLGTVAGLAEEASTSSATVVRLVQKLGYAGFPEFQETLRRELADRRTGPVERLDTATADRADVLESMAKGLADITASIVTTVPRSELDAAVALLADPKRRVYLAGGRVSHSLAEYLSTHLGRMRPGVHLLPRDRTRRYADLLDLGRRDVLVALDFRRYEAGTVDLVTRARQRDVRLVVITDVLLSPAARDATVVLPVEVDSPSPFDTSVSSVALLEVLLVATMHALGTSALERMSEWDRLADPDIVYDE
jgi:DNA-binding MurR/RpiR family transcriptional regulator